MVDPSAGGGWLPKTFTDSIALDELQLHLEEVCRRVAGNNEVWWVDDDDSFVLLPPWAGERVLGLVDVEYGWPVAVAVESTPAVDELRRSHRRHPFFTIEDATVAVAVCPGEYEDILKQINGDRPREN
jgi:hypothetical protein